MIEEVVDIADVWSGHPVNFALLTRGDRQFAAFYDANRQMTVAARTLGSQAWEFVTLSTTLGWDSHNHVAMAADGAGRLHVAGNMLYLWIYGNNVEHRLGAFWYLFWYLLTGAAAALFQMTFSLGSSIPMVGASGAISGVLGFYLVWFPRHVVKVWVFLFPLLYLIR